jgi:hypothetical protein
MRNAVVITEGKTVSCWTVLAVATVLLVAVPSWVTSSAEIVFNDKDSFSGTFINDCDGSEIFIEGVMHTSFKTEGDNRDSFHQNIRGKGVNLDTGDEYVLAWSYNDQCFTDCGFFLDGTDVNLTVVESVKLIGKGSAPNLIFQWRYRLTGPPLGDIEILHMNVQCPETD